MTDSRPILLADPFLPGAALASVRVDLSHDGGWPDDAFAELHDAERALAVTFGPARRATFVAGRRALRAALREVSTTTGVVDEPLLHSPRGAPSLPVGFAGSISHKRSRAIAIATPMTAGYVGVDLEARPSARDADRPSIADRILTEPERYALGALDPLAHREATLIRFALKEAVYKAIDPYVHRYVLFTEVELTLDTGEREAGHEAGHEAGRADVRLLLPEPHMRGIDVSAQWRFDGEWIIAVARSTPSDV